MTSVPELVKLLGWIGGVFRLQHPKLDSVANLRKAFMKVGYSSGRGYLITR